MAQSILKSVAHRITEDFTKRLNETETKLEEALTEIEKLKAKDQVITEKLSRLKGKVENLCKSESAITVGTARGVTATQATQSIPFTEDTQTATIEDVLSDCLVDVIFVLDGSGSITTENFALVKQWAMASTRRMTAIHPGGIQLGLMQYSHYFPSTPLDKQPFIKMEIPLDYHNDSDFTSAVGEIAYMTGPTYTAAALRRVKYVFLNSRNFIQSGNAQIMILVTDGRATDSHNLAQSAMDLRHIGVIPLVYGVGDANKEELSIIATGSRNSSERVTMIPDFLDLRSTEVDLKPYLRNC